MIYAIVIFALLLGLIRVAIMFEESGDEGE